MMNELLTEVSQKTGMSPEQTQQAVNAVLGFLKERLPAPFNEMLGGLLGEASAAPTDGSAAPAAGGNIEQEAMSAIAGLFGSRS